MRTGKVEWFTVEQAGSASITARRPGYRERDFQYFAVNRHCPGGDEG
jgi:hypothetical protein